MSLNWDPSRDWDRHCDALDREQAARAAFLKNNQAMIVQFACAIVANPSVDPFKLAETDVIEQAERYAAALFYHCNAEE
jgi:hypothetical protein